MRRTRDEGGFAGVQYVTVLALSLGLFVWLVSLLLVQYGRASVRAALTDAGRAYAAYDPKATDASASQAASEKACEDKAKETLGTLLPALARTPTITCTGDDATHTVTVTATAFTFNPIPTAVIRVPGVIKSGDVFTVKVTRRVKPS